jgi:hypothetical protein
MTTAFGVLGLIEIIDSRVRIIAVLKMFQIRCNESSVTKKKITRNWNKIIH